VACRYGSGMPDENSLGESRLRMAKSTLPFCEKEITSVIKSRAMAAQNLMIDKCLPYKAASRESLRADGDESGVCMGHSSIEFCPDRFLSASDPAAAHLAFEIAESPDGQRDQRQNDRAEQGRQFTDG